MRIRHTVLAFALISGAGCSSKSPLTYQDNGGTTPPANTVIAGTNLAFNPTSLTVPVGTTVTFTFQATTHNVTFATATGAPTNIPSSASTSVMRTFSTAGTFNYSCTIHAGMTGRVIAR